MQYQWDFQLGETQPLVMIRFSTPLGIYKLWNSVKIMHFVPVTDWESDQDWSDRHSAGKFLEEFALEIEYFCWNSFQRVLSNFDMFLDFYVKYYRLLHFFRQTFRPHHWYFSFDLKRNILAWQSSSKGFGLMKLKY